MLDPRLTQQHESMMAQVAMCYSLMADLVAATTPQSAMHWIGELRQAALNVKYSCEAYELLAFEVENGFCSAV